MAMSIEKARAIAAELANVLGEHYAEAINTLLEDHAQAVQSTRARRIGAREQRILDYMQTLPGVPLTPGAVQAATKLPYTPAAAMANLAQKGLLQRLSSGALYVYPQDEQHGAA